MRKSTNVIIPCASGCSPVCITHATVCVTPKEEEVAAKALVEFFMTCVSANFVMHFAKEWGRYCRNTANTTNTTFCQIYNLRKSCDYCCEKFKCWTERPDLCKHCDRYMIGHENE